MVQCTKPSGWASLSTHQRCRRIASAAAGIVALSDELMEACASEQRPDPVETLVAELLPLCSALRFIGRRGAKILCGQRHGILGRPIWLWGVDSTVRRDPHGRVLILGTWNYPLLLSGTQAAQALAAGNRVLLKPAPGCETATKVMVQAFRQVGVPESHLQQLDSSTEAAIEAIDSGVDLIVLTGAAETGRKVLNKAAESLTPSIMELSGCDAVLLMPDADVDRAVECIAFALTFNGGATCIGPRRLIVPDSLAPSLLDQLARKLSGRKCETVHAVAREQVADLIGRALEQGADDCLHHFDEQALRQTGRLKPLMLDRVEPEHEIASADLFAPVISVIRVAKMEDAVAIVNDCPYRLAASIFGSEPAASRIAAQLQVGSISLNDLVIPSADPRVPFGGRGDSGFGVTRGREGLLAMTTPTVVSRRRGKFAPHLAPRKKSDTQTLLGALQFLHAGSLAGRLGGLKRIVSSVRSVTQEMHDG